MFNPIENLGTLCYTTRMIFLKRLASNLLCVWVVLGLAGAGHAYVLPAKQILGFIVDQFGPTRTLVVMQKTVIYGIDLGEGKGEFDETLYFQFPDRFRREISTPGGEQIGVVSPGGAIFTKDGGIVSEREDAFDHFKDLLLYRQEDLLTDCLHRLNVNLNVVSLGRFKSRIAYVIGAQYPDESVPQVWIDKETFRPLRCLLRGHRGHLGEKNLEEIEYADYAALDEKRWYPGTILLYRNGELARMYVLKAFRINPKLSDQLFDIAYLRTIYRPIVPVESRPERPSDVDEVQKAIRDFRRTFE